MDAIVAISTAPGTGGIGIIRMSGEDSFRVLERVFVPKNKQSISQISGYTIKYGFIEDNKTKDIIDEVLVSYFKKPNSYTTENMCEINSHGGGVVVNRILELCLQNGAMLAEPGEFTKRAFLNGRIDLSQAESVIDIINAKTEKEVEASMQQLQGELSEKIHDIKKNILDIMVDVEVSIDYPEYDVEEVTNEKAIEELKIIKNKLDLLEKSFKEGKIIKDGIKVAIVGRPNAGKSSLLNAILKEDRAIVSQIEGTTRDTIEEYIILEGIPIKIIDTAGIRSAKDEIEVIGIEKSKKIAKEADLIIAIFDSTKELSKEDESILNLIKEKEAIIVLNKIDLEQKIYKNTSVIRDMNKDVIETSIINKKGLEQIYNTISKMFKLEKIKLDNSLLITNIRHQKAIRNARDSIQKAINSLHNNMPIDIAAINMKETLEELGKVTGESVTEDIIKEIFSKFCLGK